MTSRPKSSVSVLFGHVDGVGTLVGRQIDQSWRPVPDYLVLPAITYSAQQRVDEPANHSINGRSHHSVRVMVLRLLAPRCPHPYPTEGCSSCDFIF